MANGPHETEGLLQCFFGEHGEIVATVNSISYTLEAPAESGRPLLDPAGHYPGSMSVRSFSFEVSHQWAHGAMRELLYGLQRCRRRRAVKRYQKNVWTGDTSFSRFCC
jgi:hypothetical protein